ncbi:MAG: hypothetical protein ACE5HV_15790 [Acidobacteriota bacterium]
MYNFFRARPIRPLCGMGVVVPGLTLLFLWFNVTVPSASAAESARSAGVEAPTPHASASAAEPSAQSPAQQLTVLQQRVADLEATVAGYDARLTQVETQLAELLASRPAGGVAPVPPAAAAEPAAAGVSAAEQAELEKELAGILGEAGGGAGGQAAGQAGAGTPQTAAGQPSQQQIGGRRFTNRQRTLTDLNPEISVTADTFGTFADRTGDPENNQFKFDEFEVSMQAPLDPFSVAKAFFVQEDGEFNVEEAYVDYAALPGSLGLKVGEFRMDWAKINRFHQHGLPQVDRPLVHQAIFGEEGIAGLGVSLAWKPNPFLGSYNEVMVQIVNDENDFAFSGREHDDPVFLVHETNFFDLSRSSYFELGLSAATGVNDPTGRFRTEVYGLDWNFNWSPPQRSLYRGFELKGELLRMRKDGASGLDDTYGAYTYGVFKLNRRWFVGLRGDWTQLPEQPNLSTFGVSPYAEWWQSEFAHWRFQFSHNSRRLDEPRAESKFFFQIVWALGPHKHEKY